MYNGIGLRTVRGSGTNGYVQKNLSHVDKDRARQRHSQTHPSRHHTSSRETPSYSVNPDILLHEEKRKMEVKLAELAMDLEDQGMSESEVEAEVQKTREKWMNEANASKEKK